MEDGIESNTRCKRKSVINHLDAYAFTFAVRA